jgi:hypothetical protein
VTRYLAGIVTGVVVTWLYLRPARVPEPDPYEEAIAQWERLLTWERP